jgi:methylmalonyl-CoA mutase
MSDQAKYREKLFKEFPPVSEKEWKEQIVKDLKGREFEKLIWKTYEDIDIDPFYTEKSLKPLKHLLNSLPGEFPFVRGAKSTNNDWNINQEIREPEIKLANSLAQNSLNGGADSLTFNCEIQDEEYLGIPIQNKEDIALLLNGIDIEKVPIHFKCGSGSIGILSLFINEAKKRGVNLKKLSGSLDADPLKDLTLNGSFLKGEQNSFNELSVLISYLSDFMPDYKALKVHSSQFHNSGASITQELAFTLAAGLEYLDRLTEMGLTSDQISKLMSFSFSIGSNYFMEIAKLRAARLLWAQIMEQFAPKNESSKLMAIEVRTSTWNKTLFDPYVNLLRTTVEAMAGVLGRAGSITVRPFDSEYKTPDEFSLRMARNTQLVLKSESYLDRVTDPSGGSYYIENLTNSIAQESWKLFQKIEAGGGFLKSLKSGVIQNEIEKTRKRRDMNIAIRKDTFLGVNQYPNSTENISINIQEKNFPIKLKKSGNEVNAEDKLSIQLTTEYLAGDNVYAGDVLRQNSEEPEFRIPALKPYRGAQAFEEIRLATEQHLKKTGHKPKVFLLTTGSPSMSSARASFSSNLFGCAGFEIINNIGFDTPEDGIKAALGNDADIVVICSSDDEYPNVAPLISTELKKTNAKIKVMIAGNPKEHIKELEEAGVDDFIHVRSNALEILKKYQEILGIRA